MLPSAPCQPPPWLFTSHDAWREAVVYQAGYLSVHPSTWGQADHRVWECLTPWTFPMLTPSPLTRDARAFISGPLPRYPDVLHEVGRGVGVGAPQRLRCAIHPTVLSCHCLPSSLPPPTMPSPGQVMHALMPRARTEE